MSFDDSVGKSPGLTVWRIEDFEVVPYDTSKYGKFHTGDSYIVLKTSQTRGGRLQWDIFFWLGAETSQDEAGTAAIKAVELDDVLSGAPVQHREVQDHESSAFENCFKNGIRYLPGGVKSGFVHVDPDAVEKRLFQVKGKRNIKVKQVELNPSVLNKSDCFILDLGKGHDILVYMPPGAKRMEKFRATQAANEIRDEDHSGDANVEILDEFGNVERFFEELGSGSPDDIPMEAGDDVEEEAFLNRQVVLYKVSDGDGGDPNITKVNGKPLSKALLNQDDCFILDSGSSNGVFAWIGKGATKNERIAAVKHAEKFLAKQGLPNWTKVERVVDGGETSVFKQYFGSWKESEDIPCAGLGRVYPLETIAEWDVASLHSENRRRLARAGGPAIGFMPDNGLSGTKEIWRIEDLEMVPLEEDAYGMFFAGDSYIIKYSYSSGGRDGHIIYFWQGEDSSQDEKAAAAIFAVKLDDDLNGRAMQVRVPQGREPRHFLKMFKGSMIIFSGGKASGFKNVHDRDTYDVDGTRMYRVRSLDSDTVTTLQVAEVAGSLASEDVFILETPNNTWIWSGNGSSEEERDIAYDVSKIVSPERDAEKINEGGEPDDFWSAIGGQGDYAKEIDLDKPILKPRLFHCFFSPSGKYRANEIYDFVLKDLVSDDVMILDSGDEIYVWIGRDSDAPERESCVKLAEEYLAKDPTHRNEKNTPIFTVKEGDEPSSFKCVF